MVMRVVILLLSLWITVTLMGQEQSFGINERGGSYLPDSVIVLNEDSVPVDLNILITKPTLLSFVYYRCPALCPKTLSGIAELVNYTNAVPGEDYQIITLSINHLESVAEARFAKMKYTAEIQKRTDPYFWRFFTADSASIRKITDAVGWEFRESGEDFVHTTSSILITPERMISQYFFGTYFNYMHFEMSLEKAQNEQVEPTRLKTLKYCYNYKPRENRSLLNIFRSFGISLVFLVVVLFIYLALSKSGRFSSGSNAL